MNEFAQRTTDLNWSSLDVEKEMLVEVNEHQQTSVDIQTCDQRFLLLFKNYQFEPQKTLAFLARLFDIGKRRRAPDPPEPKSSTAFGRKRPQAESKKIFDPDKLEPKDEPAFSEVVETLKAACRWEEERVHPEVEERRSLATQK